MNNNLLVIIIFILILLIVINLDKLKIKFSNESETGITDESNDSKNYNLLETNEESDLSDAETDDTYITDADTEPTVKQDDPLSKYSKLLNSFSEGPNNESGVGEAQDLHTDNCVVCMNDLNDSMCIKNKFHSKWEEPDFTKNSPSFKRWDDAEEKSKADILEKQNRPGYGGNTNRVNRRLEKTIEYLFDPQYYAPDTLVRDDIIPPNLVHGLLRGAEYNVMPYDPLMTSISTNTPTSSQSISTNTPTSSQSISTNTPNTTPSASTATTSKK